jgi:hypothetical protein
MARALQRIGEMTITINGPFMLTRARLVFALAVLSIPALSSAQVLTSARPADAAAQQPAAQRTADRIEETAKRFRAGVHGGVGLDPEIIDIGAHVMIGPVFRPAPAS